MDDKLLPKLNCCCKTFMTFYITDYNGSLYSHYIVKIKPIVVGVGDTTGKWNNIHVF